MPKHVELVLYPENGWTPEKIEKAIHDRRSVMIYVIALHDQDCHPDGTPIKPHYHIYLNFGITNCKYGHIAKWFGVGSNCIEKIKSDPNGRNPTKGKYYTLLYYTHRDKPDKHYYPPENFVSNIDVAEYLKLEEMSMKKEGERRAGKSRHKEELDHLLIDCAEGQITPQNYHDRIPDEIYSRYAPQFKRAWEMYTDRQLAESHNTRDCKIIWITGKAGCGKTKLAQLYAEQNKKAVFITHPGNDPFDGYKGQPVIVLDELRPREGFTYPALLQFLDPNTIPAVHSRYRDKYAMAEYVFVTTVYTPDTYYAGCYIMNSKIDTQQQLNRRIWQIWYVSEDKITVYQNENEKEFILRGEEENPIPQYVEAQKRLQQKREDTLSVLREIADTFRCPSNPASAAEDTQTGLSHTLSLDQNLSFEMEEEL